jgi:hypothetical protein
MARPKRPSSKSVGSPARSFNPPKKNTYWASIVIAAVGVLAWLLYALRAVPAGWLDAVGFVLVLAAFVLLALSLRIKGP